MEFKGVAWAGNIYDKFEAMCLEVEEVIYEDTVKYMENQVQKVGASVKKFYSEVMQDLLPPSCVDPMKVAAVDLYPNTYADIIKKPKLCMVENQGELSKKETAKDYCDLTSEESSFGIHNNANSPSPQSCRVFVESTCSGLCSTKSKKLGAYKRSSGIKRISQTNRPPRTSGPTSISTETSGMVVRKATQGCAVASGDGNVTRFLETSLKCVAEEAKTENISMTESLEKPFASDKILSASPASNKVSSAESLTQEKDNSECTSSFHGWPYEPTSMPAKDISYSQPSSSVTSNVSDVQLVGQNAVTSYEDKLLPDCLASQICSENISSWTCDVESADEEVVVPYEENFDMELIDDEEVAEPVEKTKLYDTCVLVEDDMLHFVPQGTDKHKSYKKKFREALSAKLRPPRKRNQSTSQCKDSDGKNNAGIPDLTMNSNYKNAPTQDSFGSDWEVI